MSRKKRLSAEMTFGDWTDYWMEHTKGFRVITTDAKYREILDSEIFPRFRDCKLAEMTEDALLAFFLEKKQAGKSVTRMGQMLSLMSMCLTSAVNHNLIVRNPTLNLKLPRRIQRETAILTDEDIQHLMEKAEDHPYMPMILIMLLMGLRVGEAIGLDWEKVNLEAGEVRIDQQSVSYYAEGRTQEKVVPYTKNGVRRTLPMCGAARECFAMLRDKAREGSVALGRKVDRSEAVLPAAGQGRSGAGSPGRAEEQGEAVLPAEVREQEESAASGRKVDRSEAVLPAKAQGLHGPVFREADGSRVKYAAFYYEFNKLMRLIDRRDVHPHSLRHTAASTLLYETGDLLLVKDFLGHRSIRTSERYPEATEAEKKAVANMLDRFFLPFLKEIFSAQELEMVGFTEEEIGVSGKPS